LLLTGFPFLVFFNFFAISGIQENIEFTLVVRTFPFDLSQPKPDGNTKF